MRTCAETVALQVSSETKRRTATVGRALCSRPCHPMVSHERGVKQSMHLEEDFEDIFASVQPFYAFDEALSQDGRQRKVLVLLGKAA